MQIPGHLAICPGYVDAVIRENQIRDAAMLNLNTRICGVEIQQMTLRHWIILDGVDSPLLGNGLPSPLEVKDFLWVMSPKFRPRAYFRRFLFRLSVGRKPYGELVVKLRKFVEDTFQDSPPSSVSNWEAPQVSFAANVIYSIANKFHWTRDVIMNLPLKETFQHMKMIRMANEAACGENPAGFNPSDALLARERRKVREQRQLKKLRARVIDLLQSRN